MQNDFCGGGALAVPDGDAVVPVINRLRATCAWDAVVLTQDWHPRGHGSFASAHPELGPPPPFTPVQLPSPLLLLALGGGSGATAAAEASTATAVPQANGGPAPSSGDAAASAAAPPVAATITQVMWPDHCVQGTAGAEFHPRLARAPTDIIVRKGTNKAVDSYRWAKNIVESTVSSNFLHILQWVW